MGPANDYTHIHSATTRLGELVFFSGMSFADPVDL